MNKKSNKNLDIWKLVSLAILFLYILFLLYPLYKLLQNAFFTSEGKFTLEQFKSFFSQSYYVESIFNSLKVSGLATILTLIIGIPLAYFYQMYEIKGKTVLQVLIILCSMSAPFIGAYSWIMLLGKYHPYQNAEYLWLQRYPAGFGLAVIPVSLPVCIGCFEEY